MEELIQMEPTLLLKGSMLLILVCVCVCMCVHMRVYMCVCSVALIHETLSLETSTSKIRSTTGVAPRAVSLSAVVSDGKVYTFGGVLSGKAQNNVHILNLG